MISDHPFLVFALFFALALVVGYNVGIWYREVQVRRLQQANQTLRMMLSGIPYDDKPPVVGKGAEAAEQRARAWWQSRRAKLKAERNPWPNYKPSGRSRQ